MKSKAALLGLVVLLLGAGGDADDQKKELAKFAGTWEIVELTYSGDDESKLNFKVTFKGNEGSVEGNANVKSEYAKIKLKLDPTTKPKNMDLTVIAGSQETATMKGIYDFKDGQLRMCVKVFGQERPKDFEAPAESSIVLLVLKKAAK